MTTLKEALKQFVKQKPVATKTTGQRGIGYKITMGDRSFVLTSGARSGEGRSR